MTLPIVPPSPAAAPSRRDLLRLCGACAGCAVCPSFAQAPPPAGEKTRIRLLFTHSSPERPTWPNRGYDYEGRKREVAERLRKALPSVEFLPVTALQLDDAAGLLERDKEVDGYLWFLVGLGPAVGMTIAAKGRPMVIANDLYAGDGNFLGHVPRARREGMRVAGVSSTRFEDVIQGARALDTVARLKSSVILDVTEREQGAVSKAITGLLGTRIRKVSAQEFNDAYASADKAEGLKWTNAWTKGAAKIVEPKRDDLVRSGLAYVAMRDLLKRHGSRAITIDCLHLLYGEKLPPSAYPCLGFTQLNNDGMVGACEADLDSTVTMLMMSYLVERPGFISDPALDTAKNRIVYAHCVAPTKVFGPKGPTNPYHLRSHSEDRKGAVVRSLLPLNQMTTTMKVMAGRKEILLHWGKSVANVDDDKACRTKLAVEGPDIRKLKNNWTGGWHRVTFYGEYRDAVETVAALAGLNVVLEG
jgi:hypothetical protein